MSTVTARLVLFATLSSLATCVTHAAERPPVLTRSWYVNAGTYATDFSTDASVGAGATVGTTVRAEDELGVEPDQSVFRLEGLFRFNERHSIDFGYWSTSRNGVLKLKRNVEIEDVTFDLGASLDSEAKSESSVWGGATR